MIRAVLIFALILLPLSASAQYGWADRPANLTLNEFLDLWFNTQLARPESEALNSFNLVSFHPASGPGEALVVIVQTRRDERLSESDLRREIRKAADADLYRFHAMFGLAVLKKRWAPSNPMMHLVIRHARYLDVRETVGVTFKGKTEFTPDAVLGAKKAVEGAGGVWSW